jgi:Plant transposon protein
MHHSRFLSRIRAGLWPPLLPSIDVDGFPLEWYYFLADGIYPRFRFFVRTLGCSKQTMTDAEKLFCKQQEGGRKAVERVFGVLFKRFQILYRPSRLWHVEDVSDILTACVIIHSLVCEDRRALYTGTRAVRLFDYEDTPTEGEGLTPVWPPACVIIHNLVCEDRRALYTGTRAVRLFDYEDTPTEGEGLTPVWPPEEETAANNFWRVNLEGIEDLDQHVALTKALIRHQWNIEGRKLNPEC